MGARSRAMLLGLAIVGCAARSEAPVSTPVKQEDAVTPSDATLTDLQALIAGAPAGLRAVHELVAPAGADAPRPGALAWVTLLPLPMQLQVAAVGPVAVTLDGRLVFEATAPGTGALVPAQPLAVGRGELTIHVERGPAVVGFVRAVLDENPPASAFRDDVW